ncbi:DUF1656 domain-containing protein [Serratia sp. M24T3]|uniref:DUF1656 domain-containing protein n=1 Tax=Rouxiella sp. WC2420 TaxID=3234145 RepID=A0AB39VJM9_9GAMM|nr:DUF1656 domain-containing protein [Serratia sp. M24T3]EIC86064.1 hypothetical protein SPM24T3_04612 [Serratia sp. M24T3]
MIGEINIDGIFISPLLLCLISAFIIRILISKLFDITGFYSLIAQRPLFDSCFFLVIAGLLFVLLNYITTP